MVGFESSTGSDVWERYEDDRPPQQDSIVFAADVGVALSSSTIYTVEHLSGVTADGRDTAKSIRGSSRTNSVV